MAFIFIRDGQGDALPEDVKNTIDEITSGKSVLEDLEGDPKNPYKSSVS